MPTTLGLDPILNTYESNSASQEVYQLAAIFKARLHHMLTRSFAGHVSGTRFTHGWGEEIVVKHLSQGCTRWKLRHWVQVN